MNKKDRFSARDHLNQISTVIPLCDHAAFTSFAHCLSNPPVSQWAASRRRRALERFFAVLVLGVAGVPMFLIAALVRLTSRGNPLFVQKRVGLDGRLFPIYKFRSMAERHANLPGPGLTKGGDQRVTGFGRILRRFKLDELPQFINILSGDMSLIGPRPKLPQYAAIPKMPYRPGITGLATLAFRREEDILQSVDAPHIERFYSEYIKPLKARLDVCYMCKATPASDLRIIASTLIGCIKPQSTPFVLFKSATSSGSQTNPYLSPALQEQPVADAETGTRVLVNPQGT